MGIRLYTPVLLLVILLVAAESPIKMVFPKLERVISLVTRAFSFFLNFLGFCDHSWVF